ncbi:DUF2178 domain-containing protein [Leuconostoc citreum]|uniref:DUF2178 domain-containing protein n=1 Tax=Leuconostoc citreum TaxID=33964 RepID=UPI0025A12163|nr:DUF2178 domain-containing protein [Leuconostoc citreum]MDM7642627.1 DUF2178 domain-containing protein [Leuconostoc citreum]
MKINSLSDLPDALFYPLKKWSEQSIGNYNLLVGIGFIFVMFSAAFVITYSIKTGKSDERTTLISLKSAYFMLIVIIACDLFFPKGYLVNQFFMLKYGMACFVSGLYLWFQSRKDLE